MKDLTITAKQIRRELILLLVCFVIAEGVNIFSMIKYETPWTEFFTQIGFVLIITAALYIILIALRVLIWLVKLIIDRCRK
ncbi:MAG: hypothetical protein MJY73_05800 [Bacteroidales bacterium]|nr:hypothetical protein [Bacteroidales bacterium]